MLCGNAKTLQPEVICAPLVLQVEKPKNTGKQLHLAAAHRLDEILAMLVDHLGEDHMLGLARNTTPDSGMHEEWFFDADQEASEQRAVKALCHSIRGVPRLGIHHRISNNSAGSKVIKDLGAALRILLGGRVAKQSLRGAFYVAGRSLADRVCSDGFRPANSQRIERESGKTLEEAFQEGP